MYASDWICCSVSLRLWAEILTDAHHIFGTCSLTILEVLCDVFVQLRTNTGHVESTTMANIRTRKKAIKLATWDPTLLWYAKAVGEMQKRPLNDPTSWSYQAAIHGFPSGSPVDPSNPPPSSSERKKFWSQCQHHSWYFLPWHRAYLAMFEQIVMDTIVKLGGRTDWALPYWNYSPNDSKARILPPAFRG